jgi:uncharacterized Zn-finger protein
MSTKEIIYTMNKTVSCSGKESPYDHPLVYLQIDEAKEYTECPYCSKKFISKNAI